MLAQRTQCLRIDHPDKTIQDRLTPFSRSSFGYSHHHGHPRIGQTQGWKVQQGDPDSHPVQRGLELFRGSLWGHTGRERHFQP